MAELGSAQGWVTTGTATIAAIAGIVSGINSDQAKTRAAAAEAQSRATSAQLAQQAEARQLSSANRDYQLAVTRMVLDAIGKDDRRLQGALVGLVATLPEESLAKSLTEALASSGDAAVAGRANANLSALESYVGQNESDGREVLAGPTIAPTRLGTASATRTIAADASPVGTTRQLTPKKAGAWDVDIFWCQGDGDAARRVRAEALAGALRGETGFALGRLRIRPLPYITNSRPGYRLSADVIRPEAGKRDEADVAAAIQRVAAALPQPVRLTVQPATSPTPSYVSTFMCA